MKRLLSLILCAVMLVSFIGCTDNNVTLGTDNDVGTNTSNKKVELSRGKIEGDTYKSEYLGLEFTKPSSWVFSTDEEIASAMNLGSEMLGDKFKEAVEKNPSIYDMMVVDSITRTNINISYENLAKTLSTNITEEQYLDAAKKQLAGVSGMTVKFSDKTEKVKLGENEYTKVTCTTTASGVSMTQVYYVRKVDKYMSVVIATIVSGYTVDEIEAMFK